MVVSEALAIPENRLCYYNLLSLEPGFESPYQVGGIYENQRGVYGSVFATMGQDGVCGGPSYPGVLLQSAQSVICPAGWVAQRTGMGYCKRPPVDCCIRPGNPIDAATGAKVQNETDLVASGQGRLSFQRFYNSQGFIAPANALSTGGSGDRLISLGMPWRHSYQRRIVIENNGSVETAFVVTDDGRRSAFHVDGGGNWKTSAHRPEKLIKLQSGSTLVGWQYINSQNEFEIYNASGVLQYIKSIDGSRRNFIYSDGTTSGFAGAISVDTGVAVLAGFLYKVVDEFGRYIQLDYSGVGQLRRLSNSDGVVADYNFDSISRLTRVEYSDGGSIGYVYYPYDSLPPLNNSDDLLVGIVDQHGTRYATFSYDTEARAVGTEHAGGASKYSVAYPWTSNIVSAVVAVAIVDPLGAIGSATMKLVNGAFRKAGDARPAGAGSAAASTSIAYDASGNVASRDDFNGYRTCYVSDLARALEVVRTEGLAGTQACTTVAGGGTVLPAGSRKVTTQWHPDWMLESKIAAPGRITTSVYNGQADPFNANVLASCAPVSALLPDGKPIAVLCKRVEQATTDADGHLGFSASLQPGATNRVSSWTYNEFGQVLTAKGPRTDVNDTTTYVYFTNTTIDHTMGDLQSVTNALGRVTSYSKYNKYGQVREMTDPNGVLTVNSYDLRQRLLSTNVGGLLTTNTYDPAGQLVTVTLPDSSTLSYAYDAAHRLVAVTDGAGNTTNYTLDSAGNRIGEQVKNAAQQVTRNVVRRFDVLGRLESITGAPN